MSSIGHEYSLLTISLVLSYKYLDDSPPTMVNIFFQCCQKKKKFAKPLYRNDGLMYQ